MGKYVRIYILCSYIYSYISLFDFPMVRRRSKNLLNRHRIFESWENTHRQSRILVIQNIGNPGKTKKRKKAGGRLKGGVWEGGTPHVNGGSGGARVRMSERTNERTERTTERANERTKERTNK